MTSRASRRMDSVRQAFLRTVRKHGLLRRGERVLVALSGGPDSSALLGLLLEIQEAWGLEILLAHYNHGLRRNASRDERFVREKGKNLELPLFVGKADVRSFARERGLSLEEAGHSLRYDFFLKTAEETGADRVATGHTMDDQAETLLLRLLQGAGRQGLSGIHPLKEGLFIRPLLEIESQDILLYLKNRKLEFRTDESNLNRRFLRNRVRLDLIPFLKERFNPGIVPLLARTADILREEDAFLLETTRKAEKKVRVKKGEGLFLDSRLLARQPRPLARRIVRSFLRREKGELKDVSFHDVEAVIDLGEGKRHLVGRSLHLVRSGGLIGRRRETPATGWRRMSWDGRRVLRLEGQESEFRGRRLKLEGAHPLAFDDSRRAYLDASCLRFPLEVRPRRDGDRYRPAGAPGSKKLKELMRARRIPLSLRAALPVFLSQGRIVWVPGLPVAESARVTEETATVFLIERL